MMRKIVASILVMITVLMVSCQKEAIVSDLMNETFYVRNGGTDIPAFVHGNGQSKVFIIVVHGGPGGNGLEYRFGSYYKELEDKYAMVYTDQRQQGNSHGHLSDDEITIDAMIEDLHALIKTLKVRYGDDINLFMMGHSWGGTLGTAYMIKDDYQHELKGWIEVDGAHDIPMLNIELIKMIRTIGGTELAAGRNTADWQPILDYANSLDTNNVTFEQTGELNGYAHKIEELIADIHQPENEPISITNYLFTSPSNPAITSLTGMQLPEDFLREVEAAAYTNELGKITIPTLLQWGKYDFVVPPELGYSAYEKIGSVDKYLKIYEHSAHSPMNNEPQSFVKDIVDFIEAHK